MEKTTLKRGTVHQAMPWQPFSIQVAELLIIAHHHNAPITKCDTISSIINPHIRDEE